MCYEVVAVSSVVLPMMYYCINLTLVNFSRFLDEIGATQLASVSGRFASFKYECESRSSRQTTSVFHINHSFSWQSIDLFLGLFSGFGRSLNWEVDNLLPSPCTAFSHSLSVNSFR